jgi:hypothetical protein
MGKIKFRLLRKKWITPSPKTTALLFSILKRDGADNIIKAIDHLEKEGYSPKNVNDITSRITILYLSSLTKTMPAGPKKNSEASRILQEMIKEALND